ncbi:MAG: sugar phosphate nucleotidyltransferase [Candidatus Micrarchaeota archaeon]
MERVTITIDDNLLKFVDGMVSGKKAKSRSHAIDVLLKTAVSNSTVANAVILAAGKKERLWSEKFGVIKPLIEIDGKTVIQLILERLKAGGVKQVFIVVGYQGEQIVGRFKDGKELGLEIHYIWDENAGGSAGALSLCKTKLNGAFIVSYADVYYPELDVADLVKFHRENSHDAVCTLALVNVKTPNVFGVAKLTGSKIVSFTEKPRLDTQSNLVNAGISVCEPNIFQHVSKIPSSFEKELLPVLAEKEKLYGYIYSGKWMDVDLTP